MFQKVIIAGNLGADPETRTAGNGTIVGNLRVAVNGRKKVGDRWEDETTWFRVTCFGKTAENAAKFLAKGRQVLVEGKIVTGEYTNKDGQQVRTWELLADRLQFIGGRGEGGQQGGPPSGSGGYSGGSGGGSGGGYNQGKGGHNGPDDDIPF